MNRSISRPASSSRAKKFAVGLTGGIGSGKSTVADLFAAHGAGIIDTDAIAHRISASGGVAIAPLRQAFGDLYITDDGALDRARMRALVFGDTEARKRLEAILHPLIRSETALEAAGTAGVYLIFDVPLLVESGNWRQRCDRVLVVDCDPQRQLERVMQRNRLPEAQIRAIIGAQASRRQRLAVADDVIENNGTADQLAAPVERLHRLYCELAGMSDGHVG